MGDSYGGGIVVDVNYAKDEVIIALAYDGDIYHADKTLVFAEQEVDTFNNDVENGHSDWMLPSLFDAKRIAINADFGTDTENWTSTEFDNDEQYIVLYDGTKIITDKNLKSVSTNYVVVRKQVVTA